MHRTMNTIFLAIGHNFAKKSAGGSPDRGASANNVTEADTTKKIIDTIVAKGIPGFNVVKVPEGLDIKGRNAWINARAGVNQVYIELHLDAAQQKAQGCKTFFLSGNTWAEGEARQFQMEYTRVTGIKGRGVAGDKTNRWGRLGAIRDIKIFGLLVELGFITNPTDLDTIQKKGVDGVIAGIKAMFAS